MGSERWMIVGRRSIFQCETFLGRQGRARNTDEKHLYKVRSRPRKQIICNWIGRSKSSDQRGRCRPWESRAGVLARLSEPRVAGAASLPRKMSAPPVIEREATGTCLLSLSRSQLHMTNSARRQGSMNIYPCAKVTKKKLI